MNNVGDIKTFILNGNTPTQPMRFVWKWWDGSVDVTSSGTVAKQLNVGGNPADSFQVRYSCEAVNEVGQSAVYPGAVVVNNPPSLVLGSTSLLNNGGDFTFRTRASLIAYDLENSALGFQWFAGGQSIGAGNSSAYGLVSGTYAGTLTGSYNGRLSYVDHDVISNGSLTCRIHDASGGTTAIQFYLFGQSPAQQYSAPVVTGYQTAIDAAFEPTVRIGSGEYAEFSVYTQSNANPTGFNWAFYGSNGWAATTYSNGTTTELEDGSLHNQALKATLGQTAGAKTAECRIVDIITGLATTVLIPVFLVENNGPEITSAEILPANPTVGDVMSFEVTATDPDLDILTYKWFFTDISTTLHGRKVYLDTSAYTPGNVVHAIVTVTDRMGVAATQNINSTVLS